VEQSALRPQQRLDRTALVHGTIALRHLIEGQDQVEDFARFDFAIPRQIDQLWKISSDRG
jgi:hypothetical protein